MRCLRGVGQRGERWTREYRFVKIVLCFISKFSLLSANLLGLGARIPMEVLQGFMKALFACEDPFLAAGAKALPPDFVPEAAAEPTAFEAEWTKHGDGAEEAPQEELDADEFWRVSSPSKTCEIEDEPEYIVGGQLVAEPLLVSDLARGVLKELELCEAPIVLTSELSIRIVKDNLPPVSAMTS